MTLSERVEALSHTLGTRGWRDVIEPAARRELEHLVSIIAAGNQLDEPSRVKMLGLRWVCDWSRKQELLAEQLAVAEQIAGLQAEQPSDIGSPF